MACHGGCYELFHRLTSRTFAVLYFSLIRINNSYTLMYNSTHWHQYWLSYA